MERKLIHPLIAIAALAVALPAAADVGPGSFTYEGRVYESDGNPSARTVNMRLQVLNPAGTCVLRDEVKTGVDLSATGGTFAVSVGTGTTHANDPGNTIANIYRNSGAAIPGRDSSNAACAYTPVAGAERKLRIWVDGVAMTPDISINSVPYAVSADHLRGKAPSDFLSPRTDSGYALTQTNLEMAFGNAVKAAELSALADGTSSTYVRNAPAAGASVPTFATTPASATVGSFWYDTSTNQLKYKDNVGVQILSAGGSGINTLTGDITASGSGSVPATIATGAVTSSKIAAGAVTSSNIADGSVTAADLAVGAVSFANFQSINSGKILGRTTVGSGAVEEISVGSGLALTGGVLSSAGGLPGCSDGQLALFVSTVWTCVGATPSNTASSLVRRDSSGNFVAGSATLTSSLVLKDGAAGGGVMIAPPVGFTSYSLTLPFDDGNSGQVLTTDGTGVLSWTTPSAGAGDFRADGTVQMTGQLRGLSTGNANSPQFTFSGDTGSGFYHDGPNSIGLSTAYTSRLHIDSNGKVGIGTISPLSALTVHSSNFAETLYLTPTSSGFGFSLGLAEAANTLPGYSNPAQTAYLFNDNTTPIAFGINNALKMIINPDGNVGIGNSAPRTRLDVAGAIVSAPAAPTSSTSFDFMSGNVKATSLSCTAFTLHNLKSGGVYKFLVSGTSAGTCSFSAFGDGGSSPLSVRTPASFTSAISSQRSLYTLTVIGTEVFVEQTLYNP